MGLRDRSISILGGLALSFLTAPAIGQLPLFSDVPYDHPYRAAVERIARAGVTLGCGVGLYCPDASTTRSQMATFLGRAKYGPAYSPNPALVANPFADLPASHPLKDWIIQGYSTSYPDQFLTACNTSPLQFCPDSPILRDVVAQWLLEAKFGGNYLPPPASGTIFADVPASHPYARFIEDLYRFAITSGCLANPLRYCPNSEVQRSAMALFLTRGLKLVPSVAISQVTLQGTAQSTIVIEATATANDPVDAITQVTFYQGATVLCQLNPGGQAVTICTWTAPGPGTYALTATALDVNGRTRTSTPVSVSLPNVETPTASIIAPPAGSVYSAPATFAVTAFASDSGPENGALRFNTTHASGGNAYTYRRIHSGPYTVAAGDFLEYEYFVPSPAHVVHGVASFEFDLTTSPSNGRSAGLVDQNNHAIHNLLPSASGSWLSRRISLATIQGKVINSFNLVNENDSALAFTVFYRNVRITNGNAMTRFSIWTGGPLVLNENAYVNLASAISVTLPQPMIRFSTTHAAGGNAYTYHRIHSGPYTVAAGDFLEYDYFVEGHSILGWGVGAFEVDLTASPFYGRNAGLVDQNGHGIHVVSPAATNLWLSRRISLAPIQGNVINSFNVVAEYDQAGLYSVLYRNVRVTDGAATTRYPIWIQGALNSNVPGYYNLASAVSVAPAAATINRVEFLVGTDVVASATVVPFTTTLSNVPPGNYSLFARAIDNRGLMKRSDGVPVVVCGLPAVALTSPTNGQVFTAPASVSLRATASVASGCGSIVRVEYYSGATLLGTSTAGPTYPVNATLMAGTHSLTAKAYDARGSATSSAVVVTVNPVAPTITAVQTSGNSTVIGSPVVFNVTAADADSSGGLNLVLRNSLGTVIATGTSTGLNSFVVSWTPTTAGSHVVTLDVVDPNGLHATQNVTVIAATPPTSAAPAPELVIPASYPTPAIGTIAGTFAVGDSGAASYTIPIMVPPGTAGMQPSLALEYSSQGGNGLLGVGWSLSSMSAITRCPKTEAQDGVRAGVNYDTNNANDAFCLDGQRLIRVGVQSALTDFNYGGSGIAAYRYEYRTESETYTHIESFQEQSPQLLTGPYRWRVASKSGRITHYGNRFWIVTAGQTQSVHFNGAPMNRGNTAKVWVADFIADRSGNFMEIDYADRNYGVPGALSNVLKLGVNCGFTGFAEPELLRPIGALPSVEYWPTAIRYYANGAARSECGNSAKGQVRFFYSDVPSQAATATRDRYYDSGAGQSTLSKRLDRIETSFDSTGGAPVIARNYYLNFIVGDSQQTRRTLLQSVQECGADGACLPATQFEWAQKDWNTTGRNFGNITVTLPFSVDPMNQGNSGVYVADWDGDGKSDLLGWVHTPTGNPNEYRHDLILCLSLGSTFNCGTGPIAPFATYIDLNSTGGSIRDYELMDVNNDGLVDLAYNPSGMGNWQVCLSNGNLTCTTAPGIWRTSQANGPSLRGDFDGDGRIDILNYLGNYRYETCLTQPLGGFSCTQQILSFPAYPYASCNSYAGDHPTDCEKIDETDPNTQHYVLVADVNGDGKADLLRRRTGEQGTEAWKEQWKVCLSRFGVGELNQFLCHDRFVQGPKGKIEDTNIVDFNGDGLADMASTQGVASQWRVCLSTGDGAFEFQDPNIRWSPAHNAWIHPSGTVVNYYDSAQSPRCRTWIGTAASSNEKSIYGDFNGDGRTDIASWIYSPPNSRWRVCLSTGSDFACGDWNGPFIANSNPDLYQWVVSGDFNGDGKTDILCLNPFSCQGHLALSLGPQSGDLLTKITTGLAATTQITYAPLSDGTVYRKPAPSGTVPGPRELDIQSPMYVVKSVAASDGVGGNATTGHFYENLRGRTDGRGLYGFEKKRELDPNGIVTETVYQRVASANYANDWPIVGRPRVMRKYAPTPASFVADISAGGWSGLPSLFGGQMTMVNRVTSTWTTRGSSTCQQPCSLPSSVREALLTQTVEDTFELTGAALPSTTSSFSNFDAFGNPQNVTVSTSDGYSKASVHSYLNDYGLWILGRVAVSTVTLTKPGSSVVRKSAFTYHGPGLGGSCAPPGTPSQQQVGFLCDEIIEPDFEHDAATFYSLWQKTSHQYDQWGNRAATTLTFKERDGTLRSRQTSMSYAAGGRFPSLIRNALDQAETRQYDPRFGVMTRQQGPNGMFTLSLVDGFGRVFGQRNYNAGGALIGEAFSGIEASGLTGQERYRVRKLRTGSLETREYFDSLQRGVRAETRAFGAFGTFAQSTTSYDTRGRKSQQVTPAGSGNVTTAFTYDQLNRPSQETQSGSGISLTTSFAYGVSGSFNVDGQSVVTPRTATVTQSGPNVASRSTTRFVNSQGQTVRVTDGAGGNTDYAYDAYGNQIKVIGPNGITEQLGYDRRGRKFSLSSPDSGAWNYAYNGAGELVTQTDAKGQVTRQFYDALGRVIERREHTGGEGALPFVTVSSYDRYADGAFCAYGVGKLCEQRTAYVTRSTVGGALPSPKTRSTAEFDIAGRTYQSTLEIDGRAFKQITSFDAYGRVDKLMYASGYMVQTRYHGWSGQPDQLYDPATGTVHWQANARNLDGQIASMLVGGLTTSKSYDGFGRMWTVRTGPTNNIQNATYGFDALGNLLSRVDGPTGQLFQSYGYDSLNRLTTASGMAPISYSADGNITNRNGTAYTYIGGTHRVQSAAGYGYIYDANGSVQTISGGAGTRTLTYAPFNLPGQINGPNGTYLAYAYDGTHARVKEYSQTTAGVAITYYVGGYESHLRQDNVQEQRHYLATPEGIVGVCTLRSSGPSDLRYWHKDHLGSVASITDTAGVVKQRFNYDAWGQRTTNQLATGEPYAEERGFTGHEHLVEVGLTHMNGRLYDPATGRFLQSDPIVQDLWNGQSLNRYAYVFNNPLSWTDPTGYLSWRDVFGRSWRDIVLPGYSLTQELKKNPYVRLIGAAVAAYFTGGAAYGWAIAQGASAFGATVIAGSAAGFAAGGIQGGNVQSALQGAFVGGFTAGVLYGASDFATMFVGAEHAAAATRPPESYWRMVASTEPDIRIEVIGSRASDGQGWAPTFYGERVFGGLYVETSKNVALMLTGGVAFSGAVRLWGAFRATGALASNAGQTASTVRSNLNVYEVLAEAPISGTTRGAHRASANRHLFNQLNQDAELAGLLNRELGADVLYHMQSGRSFLNPPGTVWHHPAGNPTVMHLLRIGEHTNPALQPILHPRGIGGFGSFYGP